ncbi:MAG: tRNA (guanosine(46)-N7)-methyltransferase TrmB [Planctomycetota bacterium]|nr:tRNA (guanosine(46)-N7)-methyltransferase TrmB [Planctomycetota bacterium]
MRSGLPKRRSRNRRWDTTGALLDEPAAGRLLDLAAVFGNARPVEIEIGSGKGTFLLARAAARPELNFLGVEYARAYCHYAADRVRRAGLPNVRLLQAEAGHFFRTALASGTVWRVHIYFPDPWPKRRHYHRRLIQPAFAAELRRTLKPGGQLICTTDHLAYFLQIRRVVQATKGLGRILSPRSACFGGRSVITNFERKYAAQGRVFYSIAGLRYI